MLNNIVDSRFYTSRVWSFVRPACYENYESVFSFFLSLPPQVSNQVLVNQWHNLVQTLVATVIADKPVAEKASDAELCVIGRRLTAVSFVQRLGNLGFYRKLSGSLVKRFYQTIVASTFVEHFAIDGY